MIYFRQLYKYFFKKSDKQVPNLILFEPRHRISNNLCATSKPSDQPAHARSLIRAFANRLSILDWLNIIWSF